MSLYLANYRTWIWLNLLSLDAPLVAVSWQLLFAKSLHVHIPPSTTAILAMVVWLIYVGDRTLDARKIDKNTKLSARHRFYRDHPRTLLLPFLAILLICSWLALTRLDYETLRDGLLLAPAIIVYFGWVHFLPARARSWFPKELAVASLFVVGSYLPVWSQIKMPDTLFLLPLLLFLLVCWINCIAIEYWEGTSLRPNSSRCRHALIEMVGKHLAKVSLTVAIVSLLAMVIVTKNAERPVLLADALSGLAMAALGASWRNLTLNAARVLVDVALLAPLLLLPFL